MTSPNEQAVQPLLDLRDKIAKGIDWIEKQNNPKPAAGSKTALEPYGFLRKPISSRQLGGKTSAKKKTAKRTTARKKVQ